MDLSRGREGGRERERERWQRERDRQRERGGRERETERETERESMTPGRRRHASVEQRQTQAVSGCSTLRTPVVINQSNNQYSFIN